MLSVIVHRKKVEKEDSGFFVKFMAEVEFYYKKENKILFKKQITKSGAGFSKEDAEKASAKNLANSIYKKISSYIK